MIIFAHTDPVTGLKWLATIPAFSVVAVGAIAAWNKLTEKPQEPIREGECLPLQFASGEVELDSLAAGTRAA